MAKMPMKGSMKGGKEMPHAMPTPHKDMEEDHEKMVPLGPKGGTTKKKARMNT